MGAALFDKVIEALTAAIPPADAADLHVTRWRLVIALMVMFASVHVPLSCGWLPFVWSGFAQADDLRELRVTIEEKQAEMAASLKAQQQRQIEDALLDMRARQCAAIAAENVEAKRFAAERMDELQSDWRKLVGETRNYPLPTCDELP